MASHETFSVPQIGSFVKSYLRDSSISVDPFARNKRWATYTNDLNPETEAEWHMDALDFMEMLAAKGVRCDLGIFDPPYSNRQISESYGNVGIKATKEHTQSSFYTRLKNAMQTLIAPGGIVLSFGWNSVGMGKKHGYEIEEIMLVCHGGAHNDTICVAERKSLNVQEALDLGLTTPRASGALRRAPAGLSGNGDGTAAPNWSDSSAPMNFQMPIRRPNHGKRLLKAAIAPPQSGRALCGGPLKGDTSAPVRGSLPAEAGGGA